MSTPISRLENSLKLVLSKDDPCDQSYDPTSPNPQSGVAVAYAIDTALNKEEYDPNKCNEYLNNTTEAATVKFVESALTSKPQVQIIKWEDND